MLCNGHSLLTLCVPGERKKISTQLCQKIFHNWVIANDQYSIDISINQRVNDILGIAKAFYRNSQSNCLRTTVIEKMWPGNASVAQ